LSTARTARDRSAAKGYTAGAAIAAYRACNPMVSTAEQKTKEITI